MQCVSLAVHPLSLLSPSFVKVAEETRRRKRKRKEVDSLRMLSRKAYRCFPEHAAREVLFWDMVTMDY
jgi:hypothetical protein